MLTYNNALSAKEYCELRTTVGWQPIVEEQAQSGLDNSAFVIVCRDGEKIHFYEKFGFEIRPNENDGLAMQMWRF